jgi:small conductance mechanosensitive channel
MNTPPPVVAVTQLNDYNVCVELRAWLDDERNHIVARYTLREAVFEALRTAGVDMPFETFRIEPITVSQAAA